MVDLIANTGVRLIAVFGLGASLYQYSEGAIDHALFWILVGLWGLLIVFIFEFRDQRKPPTNKGITR